MSSLNIIIVADTGELEEFFRDVQDMPDAMLANLRTKQRSYQARLTRIAKSRLSAYPPAWQSRQNKFVWSKNPRKNERARRWWFANMPDSSTGFYNRTGRTGQAWETVTAFEAKSGGMWIDVTIQNPLPHASYVYGYIKDNWQRVPSHEVTGWLSAYNSPEMNATIDDVFQVTLETIDEAAEDLNL